MDRSPIDIETLARIANDLFRQGDATGLGGTEGPAPGPTAIPSVAQAAAPAFGPGLDLGGAAPISPTAGGTTFSPSAPPNRPAYGRPVSAEAHTTGYGTGQPRFGTTPGPGATDIPPGFDPRALPGFGPIPHVEDGFDVAALGLLDPGASLQTFAPPTNVPGLSSIPDPTHGLNGADVDGLPADLRSGLSAVTPGLGATPSFGLPAGGATFSPASPSTRPAFGRSVSPEVPPGTGAGLGFDPHDVSGLLNGFDDPARSLYLAPTQVPGLAAARSAPIAHAPGVSAGPSARSIDRPTPNGFEYTDAPHLGDFPEESILRAQLAPPAGAGRPDLATPPTSPDVRGVVPSASPGFYFLDDGMGYFANDVPKLPRPSAGPFNAEAVRGDFPILQQRVNGHPLIWLDNGATTQKPQAVIDRLSSFYENENSNINRSAHELAARASDAYEDARKTVQRFINAPSLDELVFVRGTTEGINFVAQSFGRRFIKAGDEIVLTHAEHHANIVPWYLLAKEVGATLKVAPFDDHGEILLDEYERLLSDRVKIVAMSHVSNALGTVLPAKAMTEMAHRHGIPVLVDGAQSISHMPIDVQDLDCDFFVFSGHKVFAPTGIGVVYGKKALLDQMPPWQGGGNMIKDVTFEKITFQPAPGRFEAGTGNIADAVGLGEAFKYLERLGMTNIAQHEHALLDYATQKLAAIKGLTIIGTAKEKAGVISFLLEGREPVEVGKALNQKGIAVRAGHHCALPILRRYGVEATVRPAFAMYNTFDDADRLAAAVREIAGS